MIKCKEENRIDGLYESDIADDVQNFFRSVIFLHIEDGGENEYIKELFIDQRDNSMSLAWSSILMAFEKTAGKPLVERPKALGDIRGVSYIYGIFYQFGVIAVTEKVREKMNGK